MKKYIDRKREEVDKYKVGDLVMLSTKDLKYQIVGRRTEKFVTKIKEIQEKVKVALEKAQKKMKRYADRKRAEVDEYRVEDLVIFSTKNLKYQIVGKRTEKLIERFVSSYKVKKIILANIVELELPSMIKIHLVVNISRIHRYIGQVER